MCGTTSRNVTGGSTGRDPHHTGAGWKRGFFVDSHCDKMTGITDVIRNCRQAYLHGRIALLLLVSKLPPHLQARAARFLPVIDLNLPLARMPSPRHNKTSGEEGERAGIAL